jgi:hypothetical protein
MAATNVQAFSGDLDIAGAITSNLEVGTANLFVDTVSGNVGIGTTSPLAQLDVMTAAGGTGLYVRGDEYGTNNQATHIRIGAGGGADNAHHAMITGGHTTNGSSYLSFSTIEDINTDGYDPAERMRIDRFGNVGIGTVSPSDTLNIIGDLRLGEDTDEDLNRYIRSGAQLELHGNDQGTDNSFWGLNFKAGSTNQSFINISGANNNTAGQKISFGTKNAEKMVINDKGYVGIGTNTPYFPLDVYTTVGPTNPDAMARIQGPSGTGIKFHMGTGGSSNNYKTTGINLSGGSAGGGILICITSNNSAQDKSSAMLYFIRKAYDQAYWPSNSNSVRALATLSGGYASSTAQFRRNNSVLEYRIASAGNVAYYALEFDA